MAQPVTVKKPAAAAPSATPVTKTATVPDEPHVVIIKMAGCGGCRALAAFQKEMETGMRAVYPKVEIVEISLDKRAPESYSQLPASMGDYLGSVPAVVLIPGKKWNDAKASMRAVTDMRDGVLAYNRDNTAGQPVRVTVNNVGTAASIVKWFKDGLANPDFVRVQGRNVLAPTSSAAAAAVVAYNAGGIAPSILPVISHPPNVPAATRDTVVVAPVKMDTMHVMARTRPKK